VNQQTVVRGFILRLITRMLEPKTHIFSSQRRRGTTLERSPASVAGNSFNRKPKTNIHPARSLEAKLEKFREKLVADRLLTVTNEGRSGSSRRTAAKELAWRRNLKSRQQPGHKNASKVKPKIKSSQRIAMAQQRAAQIEKERLHRMEGSLTVNRARKRRAKDHARRKKESLQQSWYEPNKLQPFRKMPMPVLIKGDPFLLP
jgi:hypothetical protein